MSLKPDGFVVGSILFISFVLFLSVVCVLETYQCWTKENYKWYIR